MSQENQPQPPAAYNPTDPGAEIAAAVNEELTANGLVGKWTKTPPTPYTNFDDYRAEFGKVKVFIDGTAGKPHGYYVGFSECSQTNEQTPAGAALTALAAVERDLIEAAMAMRAERQALAAQMNRTTPPTPPAWRDVSRETHSQSERVTLGPSYFDRLTATRTSRRTVLHAQIQIPDQPPTATQTDIAAAAIEAAHHRHRRVFQGKQEND